MALVTRARIAGILSVCLLLSSLGATGALANAAPPQIAGPQVAALVFGTGSCVGTNACLGATGPIGDNSCIGTEACEGTTGSIGDGSCVGDTACWANSSNVGDGSCTGVDSCRQSLGNIGDSSCNGASSCAQRSVGVGNNSCNGDNSCKQGEGSVGNYSCNGGGGACYQNFGSVGNYSCNGDGVCYHTDGVGDCAINSVTPAECAQPDARIRRIGKHNMVGNDIYNSDGTNQTLTDTLADRAVRFVITIQNDSDVASSFTIGSSNGIFAVALPPVNFYHGWHPAEDITAAVMAGTYTTPTIAPGGVYRIRAVVRPSPIVFSHLAAGPGVPHYSWLVTATTVGNPTKVDAVRFTVEVPFT